MLNLYRQEEPRNRIEQLIEDIRSTFLRISFRPTRDDFILTGEKLLALKAQCPHGTWLATLKSIGKPDVRTAQECMQWAKAKNSSFSDSMNGFLREQRAARKAAIHARREEQRQEAVENLLGVENAQRIYHKDNRHFNWPSADGIYLDPPWQDLSHYEWGAELADRVLVPWGIALGSMPRRPDWQGDVDYDKNTPGGEYPMHQLWSCRGATMRFRSQLASCSSVLEREVSTDRPHRD